MIFHILYQHGKFCYNREPLPDEHEYCFTFSKSYPCDGNNIKGCDYCKCYEYMEALQHWKDSARVVVDQETARIATCDTERKKQNYNGANYWQWQPTEGHIYQLDLPEEPKLYDFGTHDIDKYPLGTPENPIVYRKDESIVNGQNEPEVL